ncbi:MAG: hypothetical protein Ct9H300mP1_24710 [Planctomycetaceae bacterium]|nr:MAG: hypothetical protein Ct9H300mP1_24710 [Planctomycetaceae bacterium]
MGIPVQSHFLKIVLVLVWARAGGATVSAAGPVDYAKRIKPTLGGTLLRLPRRVEAGEWVAAGYRGPGSQGR